MEESGGPAIARSSAESGPTIVWKDARGRLRSADGRYWWDGTGWQKVPRPVPKLAVRVSLLSGLVIVAAWIALLGLSFLGYLSSGGTSCTDACPDIFLIPILAAGPMLLSGFILLVVAAALFAARRMRIHRWRPPSP